MRESLPWFCPGPFRLDHSSPIGWRAEDQLPLRANQIGSGYSQISPLPLASLLTVRQGAAGIPTALADSTAQAGPHGLRKLVDSRPHGTQPSDRTRESPFEAVLGTNWQTMQVTSRRAQEGLNSCGVLRREEKGTQDVGIKGQEPSSQRASHLGSQPGPGGTRLARKTASTPRGRALTQVGRAPSLTLEAPTTSSSLEKLRFGALHSGVPRLPREGTKLGGVTSRHSLARAE